MISFIAESQTTSGLQMRLTKEKPAKDIVAFYEGYDKGGNTSVAFDSYNIYKWSGSSSYPAEGWGYFTAGGDEVAYIKRDRDLGQTFLYTGKKTVRLNAITVCTGYGSNVVRSGMYGKKLSLQLFELTGDPALHDNGSDSTTEAFHGFPHDRRTDSIPHYRDDFITGERFTTLAVFTGATFPFQRDFGFPDTVARVPADHSQLKGRYLEFILPQINPVLLRPGRRYAFLIMIDKMEPDTGFTLANNYWGSYADGHAIRRDGNGVFPPVAANPDVSFDAAENKEALASAHFPENFSLRTAISPGTDGYPDVDTFRDFVFYVQAE